MSAPQNIVRGILLMLCAVFFFASMDAAAKWLSIKYPVPMLVWARYLVHCLLMLIFLLPSHGRRLWYSPRPGLQVVRALMLLGVTGFVMAAFRLLPLTVATAIIFLAPLLVGLLAGPLLKEKIGPAQVVALVLGLAGVVLIARPGGEVPLAGVVLGGCGHYLLIRAFRIAPATALAPFLYVQMAWAGLLDLIVFQHVPDGPTWMGITLIVVAGLGMVIRERLRK